MIGPAFSRHLPAGFEPTQGANEGVRRYFYTTSINYLCCENNSMLPRLAFRLYEAVESQFPPRVSRPRHSGQNWLNRSYFVIQSGN